MATLFDLNLKLSRRNHFYVFLLLKFLLIQPIMFDKFYLK